MTLAPCVFLCPAFGVDSCLVSQLVPKGLSDRPLEPFGVQLLG